MHKSFVIVKDHPHTREFGIQFALFHSAAEEIDFDTKNLVLGQHSCEGTL